MEFISKLIHPFWRFHVALEQLFMGINLRDLFTYSINNRFQTLSPFIFNKEIETSFKLVFSVYLSDTSPYSLKCLEVFLNVHFFPPEYHMRKALTLPKIVLQKNDTNISFLQLLPLQKIWWKSCPSMSLNPQTRKTQGKKYRSC